MQMGATTEISTIGDNIRPRLWCICILKAALAYTVLYELFWPKPLSQKFDWKSKLCSRHNIATHPMKIEMWSNYIFKLTTIDWQFYHQWACWRFSCVDMLYTWNNKVAILMVNWWLEFDSAFWLSNYVRLNFVPSMTQALGDSWYQHQTFIKTGASLL